MKKFTGKCDTIFENTQFRYQNQGLLCGDYVKIAKNALKNEKVQHMSSQMQEMIKTAMKDNVNLRVSYIKSVAAEAMNGPVNAANIPGCLWADIVFEYAPGMWKDPMTLPVEILEKISPESEAEGYVHYKDNIVRPNGTIIKPIEVQNTNNREKEISPNHNLSDKNVKLKGAKEPKSGRDQIEKPKKENVDIRLGWNKDVDMLSEAYRNIQKKIR